MKGGEARLNDEQVRVKEGRAATRTSEGSDEGNATEALEAFGGLLAQAAINVACGRKAASLEAATDDPATDKAE